jgi:hypothetical protein
MANYGHTAVSFDGTNAVSTMGPVYLKDIGQRNSLGGSKNIYTLGQDRYLAYGHDATFVSTSDVQLSATFGVIEDLRQRGLLKVTITPDA